jgi:hypothetical protein
MRVVVVVMAAAVSLAVATSVLARTDRAASAGSGAADKRDCPASPLRLGRAAPAPATLAALAEAPRLYGPKHDRPVADGAVRARAAGIRGTHVREMCGRRVFHRTVVVSLRFPELRESASLGSGVVFVSRRTDGYHVWLVAH